MGSSYCECPIRNTVHTGSVCVWGGLFNLCSLGSLRLAIGWSEGMKYFALKIAIAVALSCPERPRQTKRDPLTCRVGSLSSIRPESVSRSKNVAPFMRYFYIVSIGLKASASLATSSQFGALDLCRSEGCKQSIKRTNAQ